MRDRYSHARMDAMRDAVKHLNWISHSDLPKNPLKSPNRPGLRSR
jgi:hypothetical protein